MTQERAQHDHQEHYAANHRDQSTQAHQAHAGDLADLVESLRGPRYFALHAVAAGPHQPDDMQELAAAVDRRLSRQ